MRLPILMYHAVDRMPRGARSPRNYVLPEQFEAQLATLRRLGYETISFGEWLTYRRGGGDPPPPPPLLPLFDRPPAPPATAPPPRHTSWVGAAAACVSSPRRQTPTQHP